MEIGLKKGTFREESESFFPTRFIKAWLKKNGGRQRKIMSWKEQHKKKTLVKISHISTEQSAAAVAARMSCGLTNSEDTSAAASA